MARLTAAGERPSLRPAPARLPSSSAATKTFIASIRSIIPLRPRWPAGGPVMPAHYPAFFRLAKECLSNDGHSLASRTSVARSADRSSAAQWPRFTTLERTGAYHGYRTESCSHHRRIAGHRRRPRQGLSRPQLPRGRDRALDQAVERRRRPQRCRRHRRSRDGRARDRRSHGPVRPHRHAGQQRRHLHRQAVHPVHRGRLRRRARRQPRRLLPHHAAGDRGDGEAGQRPCRADHHQPGRSRRSTACLRCWRR